MATTNTMNPSSCTEPLSCRLAGLYAITDASHTDPETLARAVELALRGGARLIQYRDKTRQPARRARCAKMLRALTHRHRALLIINDDCRLADAVQADGVHLGRDDACIAEARALLGPAAIIGVSCYNRYQLARQAAAAGADYVAFGRFHPSRTKPDAVQADRELLRRAKRELNIPLVAIGGITAANARPLIDAGADMLAVVGDLFSQPDIEAAARQYQPLFNDDTRDTAR